MVTLPDAILLPVFGHLALVFLLFVLVSYLRNRAVRQGERSIDDFAHKDREPEISRRASNNLNNQFELPAFFYALIALLYATNEATWTMVLLAWVFLAGRILHTLVQVTGDNVTLRGFVFMINFAALAAMWLIFFASRWGLL